MEFVSPFNLIEKQIIKNMSNMLNASLEKPSSKIMQADRADQGDKNE